jgi:uncharacterized protein YbjT (DUF2867 family)
MKEDLLGIMGASGTLGSAVVSSLEKEKASFVGFTRHPENHSFPSRYFDFEEKDSFRPSLEGISQLLLVASKPSEGLVQFLEEAEDLEHIIVISGVSANLREDSFLGGVEKCVIKSKIPHTVLRLNWFMQNFLNLFYDEIMTEDHIRVPAGDSSTSFIDVRDIANVVVELFAHKKHRHQTYSLTGPEVLTFAHVASILSKVADRKIRYEALNESEGKKKYQAAGWDKENVNEMMLLFKEMRGGLTTIVTDSVELISGKAPTPFSEFANDHQNCWKI